MLVSGHRAQQPESLVRQALPTTTCSLANVRRLGQYERHHLTVRKSRGRSRRCGRFGDGLLTNRHPLEGSPIEASGVERTGPAALPGAIGDAVCSTAQPPGTKVGLGSPPTRTAPTASTRRTGWRTVTSGPRLPAVVGLPSRRRPEPGYENLEPSVRRMSSPSTGPSSPAPPTSTSSSSRWLPSREHPATTVCASSLHGPHRPSATQRQTASLIFNL